MKNAYEVRGDTVAILCRTSSDVDGTGPVYEVLADAEDLSRILERAAGLTLTVRLPRGDKGSYRKPIADFRGSGATLLLHRLVFGCDPDDHRVIVFRSGNSLDCRKANLILSRDRQGRMPTDRLEELYVEYAPLLTTKLTHFLARYARYYTDLPTGEDILHDVFEAMSRRGDLADLPPDQMRGLLLASGYNRARSCMRQGRAYDGNGPVVVAFRGSARSADREAGLVGADEPEPSVEDGGYADIDEADAVMGIRALLPEPVFTTLHRVYVLEMPLRELATRWGCTYNTVKSRIARYRASAREVLADYRQLTA